MGHPLMQKSS